MSIMLEWNRRQLWNGCILAGIAHAIMVGENPMMANEQSWDGLNYSVQDSSGQRGTVSFNDEYCVAAFRNDNSRRIRDLLDIKQYFEGADESVIQLANEEALQYLLDEVDGEIKPVITTAFWGRENLVTNDTLDVMMENGGKLLEVQMGEIPVAVEYWNNTYQMNDNQVKMMLLLYEKKSAMPNQTITLSKEEVAILGIKNEDGRIESKESFAEIDIFWE